MPSLLKASIGQFSDRGRKETNQDFHGIHIPKEPQLSSKGIAIALADGISSSDVSQVASQAAVAGFLADYFCTSEAWSVKKSVQQVLKATNSWLYSQTQRSQYRYDKDRGYVCTLSALVLKSNTAHIFHVGDSRIYRLRENSLEQLTQDHRFWISRDKSYLSRALGINPYLECDYQVMPVDKGDMFLLVTDGVYEFTDSDYIIRMINEFGDDLDKAAKAIVEEAYERGSADNLTIQIVRVDELPSQESNEFYQQINELPLPPMLDAGAVFEGYKIIREVHASSRSHVYLAVDSETNALLILKIPSIDQQGDLAYLERFMMEEWIARRIHSAHVVKPYLQNRKRNYLYIVTEYVEGQTLTQWMIDHPKPELNTVRGIIQQIAKGLQAFHRMEMLHQDLRPENIMIDGTGTVKIIDFGSTIVAGILEIATPIERVNLLGTAQYTAPEYFLGENGSPGSDIFSLGVIAYQMLTGKLPYGARVARTKTRAEQRKLRYDSIGNTDRLFPVWVDEAIRKAVHPDPLKRYEALSEFAFDLHQPNRAFLNRTRPPLLERDPLAFWKGLSFALAVIVIFLLSNSHTVK
ncbi:MAG: protein kinase [Sulfuricella denitrificans]|nr:protein kinase [Sulfuricella denitrificans]